ncbi:hypothetical protein SAMN04490248_13224 [Salinihabitans flavidus]|uniref:PRC-barrel domain-containing protein n=1 Tax=Salinihabitans flavidus TaxID=569882 RepID=A0A1H8VQR3_9RHOB|nr:hypothetical protein [Salinihabitans flavidus]SEP17620.1 hypothetical protein SAMN04490248_13224 [Salinihabitans flavidus]
MTTKHTVRLGAVLAAGCAVNTAHAQDVQTDAESARSGKIGEITEKIDVASESTFTLVAGSEISDLESLIGLRVYDPNDEWVGEIRGLGKGDSAARQVVVIDIGGFLGIAEKPVAVVTADIEVAVTAEGKFDHVVVAKTMNELEALPEYGT